MNVEITFDSTNQFIYLIYSIFGVESKFTDIGYWVRALFKLLDGTL